MPRAPLKPALAPHGPQHYWAAVLAHKHRHVQSLWSVFTLQVDTKVPRPCGHAGQLWPASHSAPQGFIRTAQPPHPPTLTSPLAIFIRLLQTISGLASSYPNLEQTMSSPAHGGTLTGRKFRLLTTLRNPDKTAAEPGSCSQPFVAVTRDSLFSEDGEGEEGGDREGAESSSNTQENNRR